MELWDLYDSERKPLNKTHERGQPFAEGEFYVCAEIQQMIDNGEFVYSVSLRFELYKDIVC